MRKNKFFAAILAVMLALAAAPPVTVYAAAFTDARGHEWEDAMKYAASHGYLFTYGESGMAYPDNPITRGEWAYTLDRWLEYMAPLLTGISYAPQTVEHTLTDITGHAFYSSIDYLASHGITEADLLAFRPDELMERQEVCEYMARLMPEWGIGADYALEVDFLIQRYADWLDFLPWYQWPIAYMTENGLMGFYDFERYGETFAPREAFTRGEMCGLLLKVEEMLRGMVRGEKLEGRGIMDEMSLAYINVINASSGGFNVEVTVNSAADAVNPYAIIGYTFDPEMVPTAETILSGQFRTQSHRLTEMRRINSQPDEITYQVRLRGQPGQTFYLYGILKDGAEYSNTAAFIVNLAW